MKVRPPLCLALVALCALMVAAPNCFGQEGKNFSGSRRSDFGKIFDALRQSGGGGAARISPASPVLVDGNPICGCVAMWAVKADRTGREISGPINIALHDWEPNDYLYLYFETARPILINLYQLYPETGYPNQGEKRVVLPDRNFPQSFRPIQPGGAVRLPILLKLDNTRVDETIAVNVLALDLGNPAAFSTGNPVLDNPPVTKSNQVASGPGADIQGRMLAYAKQAADAGLIGPKYQIVPGARITAVSVNTDPNSGTADYKAYATFANLQAFFKLTIHK